MKNRYIVYIYVCVTLLFIGCSTTQNREGYKTWPYESIIKDDANTLYIPIITYGGELVDAPLYKLQLNSLIETTYILKDLANLPTIDEGKLIDTMFAYIKGINVDNEFHHIVHKIYNDDRDYNDPEYLVMENDSIEKIKLDEYITTYYEGRINFKEILADVRLKMPPEHNNYNLRISLYPEGLYILYPSNQKVDYKSKTTKVNIFGSLDPKGYYVSYYRYYSVSNPIHFTEVKLPFLIDIESL